METEYIYEDTILSLDEEEKVRGEIYVMTNKINNMKYVGQTVTHRKNKGKYRPFGSQGRFKDHISEAINNTKKKQCTFLNNAIRKYGAENFEYNLIVRCEIEELNKLEVHWIKTHNTMYPNGYNLTKGGKSSSTIDTGKKQLNKKKKRGRPHGYKHKESTREKMSERLKEICSSDEVKSRMKNTMRDFYDKKKIEILSEYDMDDDIEKYIKPIRKKDTDVIHNYVIRIEKRTLSLRSDTESLDEKYDRLKNILIKAKQQQNNKQR